MGLRISDSIRIGKIRVKVSEPLTGQGRPWVSAGKRIGRSWVGVSAPVGGKKRKTR